MDAFPAFFPLSGRTVVVAGSGEPAQAKLRLLAGSPASDGLLEVDLSQNGLGSAAALSLSESPHLNGLLVLRLADNRLGTQSAAALAASPLGRRLAVLELMEPRGAIGEDDIPF